MSQYVGPPLTWVQIKEAGLEAERFNDNLIFAAVRFLEDMRESGSWHKPTLDRAIEIISRIKL